MQYFVIWPDGQKFGPATVDVLNGWIADGRIDGDSLLESVVDGSQIKASAVPGLNFLQAATATETPTAAAAPTANLDRYFVVMPDGTKYGPADIPTLTQWISEGRINAQTNLQDEMTGRTVMAGSVPGLGLSAQPAAQSMIQQPMYQQPTVPYPRQDEVVYGDGGKGDYTKSLVFSILGFLPCCPLIFSSLGIVYGNKAKQAGHPNGQTAVILGIVSMVVGVGVSLAINMSRFNQLMQR